MKRKMLVVSDSADGASIVRRQLAEVLDDWGCSEGLVADAMLVATELVTNAMLHGEGCTSLAVVFDNPSLRLEVGDRGSLPPQPHRYGNGSATGRGLYLVGALSAEWGWESQAAGKIVWAELGSPSGGRPGSPAPPWRAVRSGDEVLVCFRQVPVAAYLTMQEQNDAIHRDVDLVLIGWDEGLRSDVPEDLLRLVHEMRNRFGRPASDHRAAVESAANEGRTTVDLEDWLPAASVESSRQYVLLLERIEAYAGQGYLLVGKPTAATVQLRRWFADEVATQISGATLAWD